MNFKNKNCLVYGMGESGRSAIKLLRTLGAKVSFYDDDLSYIGQVGYVLHLEKEHFDYAIISPGVDFLNNKNIELLKKNGTKLMSELDFAYLFCKGKIIAVTGTNGKTTTCMMIYKVLKEAGYDARLCGNIGVPLSSICLTTTNKSILVCEVSSFQLYFSSVFRCYNGVILNVKPDHIDKHGSFSAYVESKKKLMKMTKKLVVLNLDDDITKKMIDGKKCMFFTKKTIKNGVFIKNNWIFHNKKKIFDLNNFHIKGEKNLENALACIASVSNFKIKSEVVVSALSSFTLSSHRLEVVGTINGVTYIDDSKATNVASCLNALSAYAGESIVLLLGGKGKNAPYDEIFLYAIKCVICYGEDGKNIRQTAEKFGQKCYLFEKFEDAARFSKTCACGGDFVILSPACSSFDEFSSYAERGEKFKEIILENYCGEN